MYCPQAMHLLFPCNDFSKNPIYFHDKTTDGNLSPFNKIELFS